MSENAKHDSILAKWLANDLNDAEKASIKNEDNLDVLKFVSDEMTSWSLPAMNLEKGLAELKQKQLKKETKVISISPILKLIAAAAVLFVAYVGWDYLFNTQIDFQNGIGETQTIILPDDSKIILDAQSTVNYDKKTWETARNIHLSGQAYFEVSKGSSFKVLTSNGSVQVLGTQFNVKAIDQDFSVNCYEGKVLVKANNQEQIIVKNEAVELQEGIINKFSIQENSANWVKGYSSYKNESLIVIAKDLERYYPIRIVIPVRFESLKFTGKLVHTDQDRALKTLFKTMEIDYSVDDKGNVTFD